MPANCRSSLTCVGATLTLAPTQRVKLTGPSPLALEYRDVPAA